MQATLHDKNAYYAEITQTAFDAISRERDEIAPSAGRVTIEANGLFVRTSKSPLWIILLGPSKHRGANGLSKTTSVFSGLHQADAGSKQKRRGSAFRKKRRDFGKRRWE